MQTSPIRDFARYGLDSGGQVRPIDGAGIGTPAIIAAGFTYAVDVWGYVDQGVEVCFPGTGAITFLDAATAPRSIAAVRTYSKDGYSCAWLERPGSLVFNYSEPPPMTELSNCEITTNFILNLRAEPAGEVIGYIFDNIVMTGIGWVPGWYKVRNATVEGWVSADHVRTAGACG